MDVAVAALHGPVKADALRVGANVEAQMGLGRLGLNDFGVMKHGLLPFAFGLLALRPCSLYAFSHAGQPLVSVRVVQPFYYPNAVDLGSRAAHAAFENQVNANVVCLSHGSGIRKHQGYMLPQIHRPGLDMTTGKVSGYRSAKRSLCHS